MEKEQPKALESECTTMIVGKNMTVDGSMIVARSEDWDVLEAKNLEIFEETANGKTEFIARDSPFRCKLPKKAYGYTALAPFNLSEHWGSAGFNTAGVGMSATESIFSNEKVLAIDPLVEKGVAENSVYNITIPYIQTAREGVERLGSLIEKHGVAEGFGVAFMDKDEIWYLETACGHRYLACRIPDDKYFVTGNQSRFRKYDAEDEDNFIGSEDLIEFAIGNNLYDYKNEEFDFHKAYSRDEQEDTTYNYPRVWGLQNMFSPDVVNDVTKNDFPVFLEAKNPIRLEDVRKAFRFHYNGTKHDPYLNENPNEEYRPVSIFRTLQTHILQVRPEMPKAIGEVNYVAMGMAALGVFVPFYQGITDYLEPYKSGVDKSSSDSAYWQFRKVQTLGMVNFNKYAPIIQNTYSKLEEEFDQRQKELEAQYLQIYKSQPIRAKELIQEFSEVVMQRALTVTNELIEKLFTKLAVDIQDEYKFAGA